MKKLTTREAWAIVGNQSKHCIRNMVKALNLSPWLNTKEDELRLAAAKICLRTNNPRYS